MSLFLAPRQLPPLETLIHSIGAPHAALAQYLEVSPRTVRYWLAHGQAPRPVGLALFFESPWGLSALDCEAVNRERYARLHAQALERECARLRQQLARIEGLADFGSANAPRITGR